MVHKPPACTMQRLNILRLFVLGWDELHVRLHQRGANGFSIIAIVLLMLEERFDMLRCDHFDRVA